MFRSLKRAWAKRQAHRKAQAQSHCNRMLCACASPAQRSVLAWAAGQYRDPVRRERVLADLTAAFNHGA